MRKKQNQPKRVRKLKQYTREKMMQAFRAVKEEHLPVDRAARLYGVPAQTIRDRVLKKVKISAKLGADSLFTYEEEESLVDHLESLAQVGYGLNRSQLNVLASDLARKLGKRKPEKKLSDTWYYAFLKRWDNRLKVIKPRALSSTRAASLTQESIDEYYAELNEILDKYNLKSKPHLIYNLDETGIQPEHRPSKVITGVASTKTQAITSPNSATTTLIGCINAAGTALPPYYVFKGKRRNDDFMKNAATGSDYTLSDSGWVNGNVLMKYLEEHFLKYVQRGAGDNDEHILLIYDGHASHGAIDIIKWARQHNIILFVLPPHSSHALQPLDIGCFGPFKSTYYSECNLYMAKERGRIVTKYEIAELSGKAYTKTMTPSNIQSAFKKAGISPFNNKKVPVEMILPSKSFQQKRKQESEKEKWTMKELLEQKLQESAPKVDKNTKISTEDEKSVKSAVKMPEVDINTKMSTEDEKSVKSAVKKPKLGGKAITEDNIFSKLIDYEKDKTEKNKTSKTKQQNSSMNRTKSTKSKTNEVNDPKPSTSGINVNRRLNFIEDTDSESEMEDADEDKCCICEKFSPPGLKDCVDVVIVKWAQCTKCNHWCHLRFCSKVRVVRRLADFFCPHCIE